MRHYLLFALTLFSTTNHAALQNVDIYGADPALEKKIMACCSGQLAQYDKAFKQLMHSHDEKDFKPVGDLQLAIIKKINRLAPLSEAKISSIYYPMNETNYHTVDIVQNKESYRIPNSPKRSIEPIKLNKELTHLFTLWDEYSKKHFANPSKKALTSCPVSHCIWEFDAEDQKKYLPTLKRDTLKYKKQLFNIVLHGTEDQKRGDAVFILGHLQNYQELSQFLIQFTDDADETVRNNSMRVLGAIAHEHHDLKLDIARIIAALNYPYVTDRNKASFVLSELVNNKSTHQQVIRDAGPTLIKLLRLKQPNNHDFAYTILKTLSNKNYAEQDLVHWQQWLDQANKSSAIS